MCIQLKPEAFNCKGHEVSGDKRLKSLLCTEGQWPGESQRDSYLKGKKSVIWRSSLQTPPSRDTNTDYVSISPSPTLSYLLVIVIVLQESTIYGPSWFDVC